MYGYIIFILLVSLINNIENKKHLRIIGGRDAEENEYLHVARVEVLRIAKDGVNVAQRGHLCTSAILTPVWTLTAAHCVKNTNELLQKLNYIHSKTRNSALVLTREIKSVIWFGNVRDEPSKQTYSDIVGSAVHPAAKWSGFRSVFVCQNDVGLFRTEPIAINQYAKLSALNDISLRGHEVKLVGYGLTNSDDGRINDTLLLKKPLQILTAMVISCPANTFMYPGFCVARACGQSATMCPGDSGGPVLHPSGIVAILSMGNTNDCFVSNEKDRSYYVAKFVSITSYLDWISDVINNNNTSLM